MRAKINVGCWLASAALFLLLLTYALLTSYRGSSIINTVINNGSTSTPRSRVDSLPLWDQRLDFARLGFSNETGNPSGCYVVPNYIHFIRFGPEPVSFVEFICILAAYFNQKPEKIFFHYDDAKTFSGKYWEHLLRFKELRDILVFKTVTLPDKIFGQPLSRKWQRWHGSDITRIRTIMRYGGIFLDNDSYLVKSLDTFRKFEIAMNWDEGQFLASQAIVAHRDARFLRRWLECYKVYDASQWYYNAGERPTVEVLYPEPELIHRVKVLFGADNKFIYKLYGENWSGWKDFYILHLLSRHLDWVKSLSKRAKYPVVFSEENIGYYPTTFREMVYDVYDKANISWPQYRFDD